MATKTLLRAFISSVMVMAFCASKEIASITLGAEAPQGTKTRRLIVNDDGEVRLPGNDADDKDWDRYLAKRIRDAVGTQVDSYFLNIGSTDRGYRSSLQSVMGSWATDGKVPAVYEEATRRHILEAHRAGMEIFASIRINDSHDKNKPNLKGLTYPLKQGRPDLLLGNAESMERGLRAYESDSIMRGFWSALNWGKPEVREHFLDFIRWYCPQYDFDGLELDYFRHPLFFKLGEEEQHADAMTEFVRQVRRTLNAIGKKRGRPYLLAVRVPDTPALARRSGLDVETWLEEGLLDLLIVGGGYKPYGGQVKEFIDLAHQHGIPAYPCLNHFRGPVQMRSVASNSWALGGDGFYLFNYYGVTGKEVSEGWGASDAVSLREVGSTETLQGKDKVYLADTADTKRRSLSNIPSPFPVRIVDGRPVELVVGDDVRAAEEKGSLKGLRLQFTTENVGPKEQVALKVNGATVAPESIRRTDNTTFEALLPASLLRRGKNQIVFAPGRNSSGRQASAVSSVKLLVQYR